MYDYLFSDFGVHKRMLQSQPFSTGSCSESCRCYHHNQSLDRDGRWGYTNGCFTHNLSQLGRIQSRVAVIITINPWVVTVVGVHKRMLQSQPFSTGSCSESCRCYHHNQSLDRDGRWGTLHVCRPP